MNREPLPALATIRDLAEYAGVGMRRVQYLAQARGIKPYERVGTVRLYDRKGQQDILLALNFSVDDLKRITDPKQHFEASKELVSSMQADHEQWELDALELGFDEHPALQNTIRDIQKRQVTEFVVFYHMVLASLRQRHQLVERSYDEIMEKLGERQTRWLFQEDDDTGTVESFDPTGTWDLEAAGLLPDVYHEIEA